ncbi:glycosyltransferase [Fibrobacterota bacterium]
MNRSNRSVCLYGHHELDYPRNRIVKSSMEKAGWRVFLCHSRAPFPFRHFILMWKYLRIRHMVSVIWITEGGHRLVPFAGFFIRLTGKKVIFDPFISRYNTRIEDRRLYSQKGLQSMICRWQDWSSTRAADFLVFDTPAHKQYFFRNYSLAKPYAVFPVGAEEDCFNADVTSMEKDPAVVTVLFYGTFIPLQGVEHIVEAALNLKEHENIRFMLVGEGQTLPAVRKQVRELSLSNLTLHPRIPQKQLAELISRADISLGVFGATPKTRLVIPNKVVQSAAMGKAIITCRTEAIQQCFTDGKDILMVNPADSRDLAEKIMRIMKNPDLKKNLQRRARDTYEKYFSSMTLSGIMNSILSQNAA